MRKQKQFFFYISNIFKKDIKRENDNSQAYVPGRN